MFTALTFNEGKISRIANIEHIREIIAKPDEVLWLDLHGPSEHELQLLEREFGFHRLATEDVRRGLQRPKLDVYEGFLFVVMYSVSYREQRKARGGRLHSEEVHIFVGRNYVVTVHQREVKELNEVIQRWEEHPEVPQTRNVGFLLYTICDTIVDNYFPVVDDIGGAVDSLEEKVFSKFSQQALSDAFALRKELLALRRFVGPERDVVNALMRRDLPLLGDETNAVYFADVYDHLIRVADTIDIYRDLLSGALEGYLSVTSNNLNQVMKVLTAASIILMSMSVISGIYGMNFRNMPELDWGFGYAWALGLMIVAAGILFIMFRRRDWL